MARVGAQATELESSVGTGAMTPNERWCHWIIQELVAQGVRQFCISPGSRSTPLTVAAARHPRAQCQVFLDERAAAYFALGWARAQDVPAALICTSGTAAANYFPAVIEASVEHLPLLVLSADRPPELQQSGANQTIDQTRLFGSHVRWFHDPGCPVDGTSTGTVQSWVAHAFWRSQHPDPGPVHLNLPFREPFLDGASAVKVEDRPASFRKTTPAQRLLKPVCDELVELLSSPRGWVTVGTLPISAHQPVQAFLEQLGWPVHTDLTSGLRFGPLSHRIDLADQLLIQERWQKTVPGVWLHLGNQMVSKRMSHWWASCTRTTKLMLTDHTERQDPHHQPHWQLSVDWSELSELKPAHNDTPQRKNWRDLWLSASLQLEAKADEWWNQHGTWSEASLVRELIRMLSAEQGIFVGNSLPIRELDMLAPRREQPLAVAANRGASGIDGLLATACGWAQGRQAPTTVILGDLSLLHDLNSLLLLRDSHIPMLLIVLNNNGGGIFSMLPVVQQRDVFERFFGTPHGCGFAEVAQMFNLSYAQPTNLKEFQQACRDAWARPNSTLLEVQTERTQTASLLQRWQQHLQTLEL